MDVAEVSAFWTTAPLHTVLSLGGNQFVKYLF